MTTTIKTPWGIADNADEIAPGITRYDTPSHGGYHLDKDRQARVEILFPEFHPFAGPPWYEEDQDWAVLALAFPEYWPTKEARAHAEIVARKSAELESGPRGNQRGWASVVAWIDDHAYGPYADLIRVANTILHRLDLEAAERGSGAVFVNAANREPLRAAIAKAEGR